MTPNQGRLMNTGRRISIALATILTTAGLNPHEITGAPLATPSGVRLNKTNFGPSGTNLGQDGFWFANFGASSPSILQPVDTNDANSLPSWMQVDFNPASPNYGFALNSPSSAFSTGGVAGYNVLTLPDGTTGLSGQLVDNANSTGSQSNNIITRWVFGPGAPSSAFISIVLDNAPLSELTTVQRVRLTNRSADGTQSQNATFDNLAAGANGIADAYIFRLDNIEVGGSFSVQLRTLGAPGGADMGLAGVLFQPIPEPSSLALAAAALLALTLGARLRGGH